MDLLEIKKQHVIQ